MAKKKQNRYSQRAKRASLTGNLTQGLPTKGNIKNTSIETLKDLIGGVIVGGAIGAAVGKPSLLVGIGVTGLGHFMGQRLLSQVGVGMMASNIFQKSTVSGLEGLDGVKDRLVAFKEGFKEKLYLDKILKKKQTVEGIGNLQYFNYPNEVGNTDDDDLSGGLSDLNNVERQLEESAMNRLQISGIGAADAAEAMDGGLADVSDYNL